MGGAPGLSRKRINSVIRTSAKWLAPSATRAIGSGEPLAILVATARPSEPNKPRLDASTKGAASALRGRSRENWIAIGCRTSLAAGLSPAPNHAKPNRPISKAKMRRTAIVGLTRMGNTSGPDTSFRAGYVGFMTTDARRLTFWRIKPERLVSATVSPPIVQPAFALGHLMWAPW